LQSATKKCIKSEKSFNPILSALGKGGRVTYRKGTSQEKKVASRKYSIMVAFWFGMDVAWGVFYTQDFSRLKRECKLGHPLLDAPVPISRRTGKRVDDGPGRI
jgi:hypothetical protein